MRRHVLEDVLSHAPQQGGEPTAKSPALVFGERQHAAVALRWRTGEPEQGTEYLRAQEWPLDAKHTLGLALQCYASYVHSATLFPLQAGQYNNWEILALEERVVMPVDYSDVRLSFQLDKLLQCRYEGQRVLCMTDLKTASRVDTRWIRQWDRDLQMRLYSEAIRRKYGEAPEYMVVEAMNKTNGQYCIVPLREFTQDERNEAWRQFLWVAHHDAQLLDMCTLPDGSVDVDRLVWKALTETPQNRRECHSYGRDCPFLMLCDAQPDERPALLAGEYAYAEPEWV